MQSRLGHSVNANIALVTGFSLHHDRGEAIRRGQEGFEFFGYALNASSLTTSDRAGPTCGENSNRRRPDTVCGQDRCTRLRTTTRMRVASAHPTDARRHLRAMRDVGVDQVIFIQQAGRNRHEDICASLELFACGGVTGVRRRRGRTSAAQATPNLRRSSRLRLPASSGCSRWPTMKSPSSLRR